MWDNNRKQSVFWSSCYRLDRSVETATKGKVLKTGVVRILEKNQQNNFKKYTLHFPDFSVLSTHTHTQRESSAGIIAENQVP